MLPTLEIPSTGGDSNESRISRIFQRSSALFRTRPVSTSSAYTTETALPQYSIFDPGSTTSISSNQTSPTEDVESYGSCSIQLQGQHREPVVLRFSGTFDGDQDNESAMGGAGRVSAEECDLLSFPVKGTKPWIKLHLYSPKDKHLYGRTRCPTQPQIYGGGTLKGVVEIAADKPIAIRNIKFIIKGRMIMGASAVDSHTFLNRATHVWNKSNGDPRPGRPAHSPKDEAFDGKFIGYYEIPFVCPIPSVCDIDTSYNSVTQFGTALPPSFFDTAIATTIQYEVYLQISHGRFRPDTRITTGITYVPTVTPPLMPQSRRVIYEAIPGKEHFSDHHSVVIQSPLTDPAGWVKCPSATLNGVMADINKPIKVACDLYLARPLSYTRGTLIPCFLSLSSDDSRLLDVLCTPASPCVHLTRVIHHTTQAYRSCGSGEDTSVLNGTDLRTTFAGAFATAEATGVIPKISTSTSAAHRVASAVWWKPTKDVEQRATVRYLVGEIHLASPTMPPSSSCSFFRIEYFVEMLPFRTQSCTFEAGTKDVVISQLVEIASTLSPEGTIPVPFTRPPRCQARHRSRSDVVGGRQRSESVLSFTSQ